MRRLRPAPAGLVLAALVAAGPGHAAPPSGTVFKHVLSAQALSEPLCHAAPNRIFIATDEGSECVAYAVTTGFEDQRRAVIFLDGDASPEKATGPGARVKGYDTTLKLLQRWSDRLKVRYIAISRLGLNGSSGNHGERRKPRETLILDAAIDLIKARLGLDTIALAGQSGGSTIAASLLSLGRTDVACAVLGSGAFELVDLHRATLAAKGKAVERSKLDDGMFDPARDADLIARDPRRRVFVIGDEADTRTPWDQQTRYAGQLKSLGHHAALIPIEAAGELDHSATRYTIPTAGGCLTGTTDEKLERANQTLSKKAGTAEAHARPAASSASMALMRQTK